MALAIVPCWGEQLSATRQEFRLGRSADLAWCSAGVGIQSDSGLGRISRSVAGQGRQAICNAQEGITAKAV